MFDHLDKIEYNLVWYMNSFERGTLLSRIIFIMFSPFCYYSAVFYSQKYHLLWMELVLLIIKTAAARNRPYENKNKITNKDLVCYGKYDRSFVSGHTFYCMSICYVFLRLPYGVCLAVSLLVGLSRIHLGVHYPSDVLSSILLFRLVSGWID